MVCWSSPGRRASGHWYSNVYRFSPWMISTDSYQRLLSIHNKRVHEGRLLVYFLKGLIS